METKTVQQDLMNLSKEKWLWMADKNMEALEKLFHEKSVFVHMGGNMCRDHELGIIREGVIHYKHAEIEDMIAEEINPTTVIVYSKLQLDAVVGGHEVTNPFMVTEVYVHQNDWMLASMAFTRLLTPEDRPRE
jgi:hypothetical protein